MASVPHICTPSSAPTGTNVHICTSLTQTPHICAPIAHAEHLLAKPKPIAPNQTLPSTLCPHVSAPQHFLHWMTPFGLAKLSELNTHLSPLVIAQQRVVLVRAIKLKTLGNYSAGLLRFTQFCDNMGIPEDLHMPAPEWLLSHVITTKGAGSLCAGAIKNWLLGL